LGKTKKPKVIRLVTQGQSSTTGMDAVAGLRH